MKTPLADSSATIAERPSTLSEPRRRQWLLWLVVAQAVFVLGVAAAGYATSALGRTIWLRTAPVDPRDLLYGDYLVLNYNVSQLPGSLWHGAQLPRRKQAAYVVLEPRGSAYEAVGVYDSKPTVNAAQVILRGSVQDVWHSGSRLRHTQRYGVRMRYGLERYYVPQDMGRQLTRRQQLRVQVSIAPWGQARITKVEHETPPPTK
ncbi:GDYXXLXY domain-containing protein [Hymenobacter mucosus]|uniref:Uncharacterized membrane-anchored protein n=1 Tax=Hymenobacter mucosus TaxID=1411120 RepID=A0A238X194_9BACT|nr:GDYXXLXY domain-containing protein [Hymenobacter mucosus]SNR52532.1 Uncharacterized membrane-anchored protein [Hymenobacter mucosus]